MAAAAAPRGACKRHAKHWASTWSEITRESMMITIDYICTVLLQLTYHAFDNISYNSPACQLRIQRQEMRLLPNRLMIEEPPLLSRRHHHPHHRRLASRQGRSPLHSALLLLLVATTLQPCTPYELFCLSRYPESLMTHSRNGRTRSDPQGDDTVKAKSKRGHKLKAKCAIQQSPTIAHWNCLSKTVNKP
jgi:hypothetical protein